MVYRVAAVAAGVAALLAACSGSSHPTVAGLVASLPHISHDVPAGPFTIGRIPAGHVVDNMVRGTAPTTATTRWCVKFVCASAAFTAWRSLAWSGVGAGTSTADWPAGTYAVELDAPAPRVDDDRRHLLPTGTAFDIAMLPGSRADLAIGTAYHPTDDYTGGEEGPTHDVWFESRVVRVGHQDAVLTESYGTDEKFARDTKVLYFEGPHRELGVVRAVTDVFYGDEIWSRATSQRARDAESHREAARQQVGDDELIALAASVRAASPTEWAAAAERVAAARIAVPSCAPAGPCGDWQPVWGDSIPSPRRSVYFEYTNQGAGRLFALAPGVRNLRVTQLTRAGQRPAGTVPVEPGDGAVVWAYTSAQVYRVTALDANGHALETVRVDQAGP